jgi:spore coat polysaccharide biosynthesis protein SpsF
MNVVAVIQARMGSSRLPGKVMLPLASEHVIIHDVSRVDAAQQVDETVVATSTKTQDDIVTRYASRGGASVFRGSESDVLGRMLGAAREADADIVVRVTGDCPLVAPEVIDAIVERLLETEADYVSSGLERTFPRGLGAEAFTFDSFETVGRKASKPYEREHVTTYYQEYPDQFDIENVESTAVFHDERYHDRTDLRLTLDEADDYELFRRVYDGLDWTGIIDVRDAINYIDEYDLANINNHVQQLTLEDIKGGTE